jgi:hypothetical protein
LARTHFVGTIPVLCTVIEGPSLKDPRTVVKLVKQRLHELGTSTALPDKDNYFHDPQIAAARPSGLHPAIDVISVFRVTRLSRLAEPDSKGRLFGGDKQTTLLEEGVDCLDKLRSSRKKLSELKPLKLDPAALPLLGSLGHLTPPEEALHQARWPEG